MSTHPGIIIVPFVQIALNPLVVRSVPDFLRYVSSASDKEYFVNIRNFIVSEANSLAQSSYNGRHAVFALSYTRLNARTLSFYQISIGCESVYSLYSIHISTARTSSTLISIEICSVSFSTANFSLVKTASLHHLFPILQ